MSLNGGHVFCFCFLEESVVSFTLIVFNSYEFDALKFYMT